MIRALNGTPGSQYWQQRVDYKIRATLEPQTRMLRGSARITYTNASPDELAFIWFNLEMPGPNVGTISQIFKGSRKEVSHIADKTKMRVDLAAPAAPNGGTAELAIEWSFEVQDTGDRMGFTEVDGGTIYAFGQWYPRPCVYDDVHGWNTLPFLGDGEFYASYGNFEVHLVLPSSMLVAAGGQLTNPQDVLTSQQLERLARARLSKETIDVVSLDEVGAKISRPPQEELTWVFRAYNVRDFAWACSDRYAWQVTYWGDVALMAFYPRSACGTSERPGFERSLEWTKHAVSFYSERVFKYPFDTAITAAVRDPVGMEYPLINFSGLSARGNRLLGRIEHEIAHNWFPMLVNSNERRHGWMDEGLATFMNYYSLTDIAGEPIDITRTLRSPAAVAQRFLGRGPTIMSLSDAIGSTEEYFWLHYIKAAYGLVLLREYILEQPVFDEAFRTYIERWKFKAAYPEDFFRTIEDVSGRDLRWFWDGWFYANDSVRQMIEAVLPCPETGTKILLTNRGELPMPVEMAVGFESGASVDVRLPVDIWLKGREYCYVLDDDRLVAKIVLDPRSYLPVTDRTRMRWETQLRTR